MIRLRHNPSLPLKELYDPAPRILFFRTVCPAAEGKGLFLSEPDFQAYFRILKRYKDRLGIRIFGFCLMSDHVQLVVQPESTQMIASFLNGVNHEYAVYFNSRYGEIGRLFGHHKLVPVETLAALFDHIKYVESEPVRANIVRSPVEYSYSSCFYRVLNERNLILDPLSALEGFL